MNKIVYAELMPDDDGFINLKQKPAPTIVLSSNGRKYVLVKDAKQPKRRTPCKFYHGKFRVRLLEIDGTGFVWREIFHWNLEPDRRATQCDNEAFKQLGLKEEPIIRRK